MTSAPERAPELLSGTVERIVFHNPDSGWCVLKVKVKGRRRLVSVVGTSPFVAPGETIEAEGEWTEHSEHGERLVATKLVTTLPRAAGAAEKYLSSGLVKGIGPELAKRMVEKFGAGVFDVIEGSPKQLEEVEGIGPMRAQRIRESWSEQRALRGIMTFLGTHGLSVTKAPRILRTLGADALSIIEKNPYRLSRDVPGIGFKSADLIARHTGVALDSDERFASAIHNELARQISKGHCGYPEDWILSEAAREVGFPPEQLESAMEAEIESGRLTEDTLVAEAGGMDEHICIFPANLAAAERRLAARLVRLAANDPPWGSAAFLDAPPAYVSPKKKEAAMKASLARAREKSVDLSAKQMKALKRLLSAKVSVLTGGPGTGKTTLIRFATSALQLRGWNVMCCAPTGRAAQKLTESAGIEAQTIHRLLGWDPETHGFRYRMENPLSVDLLIVDEASMVGLELMDSLIEAVPESAAILLVGDADQLPSVQAGRVLESIIESGVFTHAHLEEIFRQVNGHESLIVHAAQNVLHGETPELKSIRPDQDFHFIEARNIESCLDLVVRLVKERIPARFGFDPVRDVQVLCPMNKGLTGARNVNKRLQAALNPSPLERIERFGQSLATEDKVIVTMNDYDKDVFNGDIGRVIQIERERSSLRLDLNGRRIDFEFTELDSLALAFAITVHKSQGSEYDAIVIPLMEESAPLLGRNLLYTAITRGKRLVVVVGSREALRLALRSEKHLKRRWSGLSRRIRESRSRLVRERASEKPAPEVAR